MSLRPEVIDAMVAAGCTAEQIAAAVKADMAASMAIERERQAAKREANRIRQQRKRERDREGHAASRDVTHVTRYKERVSPHTPLPKETIPPSPPKGGSSPTDQAFADFRDAVEGSPIPAPRKLTADRRRKIEARLREHGPEVWREACDRLAASPFCRGENDRGWRADLDFLVQPTSFNRLIEGGYDARPSPTPRAQGPPAAGRRTASDWAREELRRMNGHDDATAIPTGRHNIEGEGHRHPAGDGDAGLFGPEARRRRKP